MSRPLGRDDLLQSLTYGNGLILWKNFSLDNELYQIVLEQGINALINRFYNRADKTNFTGIVDGLAAGNNEALTYNDAARLSGATTGAGSYGTRLWTYDWFSAPPLSGKPLAGTPTATFCRKPPMASPIATPIRPTRTS